MKRDERIGKGLRILDDASDEARRGRLWLSKDDSPPYELPDFSEAEARRRSAVGNDLVLRIDALDRTALPRELERSLRIARGSAALWSREGDWWWIVCDPLRVGFFSLFAPTAYSGAFLITTIHKILGEYPFRKPGDTHRYLALIADYGRLIDQLTVRTRGQAERGIRMPKAQIDRAVPLFASLRETAPNVLAVAEDRLRSVGPAQLNDDIAHVVDASVLPAYDRLLVELGEAYRAAAPDDVGMSQYPRGRDIYEELVRLHTTLPFSAADVHAKGIARMAAIVDRKLDLARSAGFDTAAGYERELHCDRRWRSDTAEGIADFFQRCIDRIAPELPALFDVLPSAGATVAPLPHEVSGSMTFGYYQQPSAALDRGTYFFNAANLSQRGLQNVAALTYHELMPGHHLHVATQLENDTLPELRSRTLFNAFNEGWAEYAATLAGEMGMYETPDERYGRLMMDAFLTCRLVVDTGMNALGWSLERARDYLRTHSGMSEAEIASETLRYSCDIPAQSLAYKLGDDYLIALREEMRGRLGERFDIRDFHTAVLQPGSRPYDMVAEDVRAARPRIRDADGGP